MKKEKLVVYFKINFQEIKISLVRMYGIDIVKVGRFRVGN